MNATRLEKQEYYNKQDTRTLDQLVAYHNDVMNNIGWYSTTDTRDILAIREQLELQGLTHGLFLTGVMSMPTDNPNYWELWVTDYPMPERYNAVYKRVF
jgi:hypothetical protein